MSAARVANRDGAVMWHPGGIDQFPLPARGHGATPLSPHRIVLTGRRPGRFVAILSVQEPKSPLVIAPDPSYRVSGHSAIHPSGKYFFTSEFEANTMRASLAVRRAEDGKQQARWAVPGIEPHDLLFTRGRLIVAVGGLVKDGGVNGPAFNPDGIDSAVVELHAASGTLLARHKLPPNFASLSLRHLARTPDGEHVVVAMQDQDLSMRRPLIAIIAVGKGIRTFDMPDPKECDFRGYAGSVVVDPSGEVVAVSSPRGSVIGFWSTPEGQWLGHLTLADACGLAPGEKPGEFWASSGLGDVLRISVPPGLPPAAVQRWSTELQFDNHLLALNT